MAAGRHLVKFKWRYLRNGSSDPQDFICSLPVPLNNKPYHPRLRFESCLTYDHYKCCLLTYLLWLTRGDQKFSAWPSSEEN